MIFLTWIPGQAGNDREARLEYARKRADWKRLRLVFAPSGSPFERGESNKEDPLTFRLALNEG